MIQYLSLVLCLLVYAQPAFASDPSPVTLESIAKTYQAREKALTSLEIHGREIVVDEAGVRKPNTAEREFTYTQTSNGQRELREIRIAPDGTRTVEEWVRDDGSKLYMMQCTPKSENVIEYVVIQETPNQPSRFITPTITFTNLLTPRGKRMSDLMTTGQSMNITKTAKGDQVVEVQVKDGGYQMGLQLSGDHDFLPQEVKFGNRSRKVVTTYRKVDGFWFPESGYSDQLSSTGSKIRMAFQVDRILVNSVKPSKDFAMPQLNVGTVIHDQTKTGPPAVFGVSDYHSEKARKAVNDLRSKYGSVSQSVATAEATSSTK